MESPGKKLQKWYCPGHKPDQLNKICGGGARAWYRGVLKAAEGCYRAVNQDEKSLLRESPQNSPYPLPLCPPSFILPWRPGALKRSTHSLLPAWRLSSHRAFLDIISVFLPGTPYEHASPFPMPHHRLLYTSSFIERSTWIRSEPVALPCSMNGATDTKELKAGNVCMHVCLIDVH